VLLLLLAACSPSKPEAASLVAGVDQFHRASNDDRPARADELAKIVCEDPEVCAVKAACVEATGATAKALRIKQEAEIVLAELEAGKRGKGDPDVQSLPGKLDEATMRLKEGHDKMPACDQRIIVLRGKYGL
jgi:hypothetical protein